MDYKELDELIERLRAHIDTTSPQKGHWKELWALAGQVGAGFRGVRYMTKADKDAAWQRFQELCSDAKAQSEASRRELETRQQEWEKRKTRSEHARSGIEGRAAAAQPLSGNGQAIAELILFPLTMIERVLGMLLGIREKSAFEEARAELQRCNVRLKEAWRAFTDHKSELLPADKAQCFQTLSVAQEKLNEAWARLKKTQDEFYTGQRAAHQQRQLEWEQKQRDFRDRVSANIVKLEGNLDKARAALARQNCHLEKLESDYNSARGDAFRDRCSSWIGEAKERISDIESSIDRIQGWLSEERAKLR